MWHICGKSHAIGQHSLTVGCPIKVPTVPVKCRFLGPWYRDLGIVGLERVLGLDKFSKHLRAAAGL